MTRLTSLVAVIALIAGCSKKNDAPPKSGDGTPPASVPAGGPAEAASGEPAYRVTGDVLGAELQKELRSAEKKYTGKVVEVSAPVEVLEKSPFAGGPECRLYLRGNPAGPDGGVAYHPIYCLLTSKQLADDPRLQYLNRGQSVTIRGKVRSDLSLSDCTVVAVGPLTAIPTTLESLVAELGKEGLDLSRGDRRDFGRFKDNGVLVRVTIAPTNAVTGTTEPEIMGVTGGLRCNAVAPKGSGFRVEIQGRGSDLLSEKMKAELKGIKAGDSALFLAHVNTSIGIRRIVLGDALLLKSVPEGLKLPEDPK